MASNTLTVTVGVRRWLWPAVTAIAWVSVRVFRRQPPWGVFEFLIRRAVYVARSP